MAALRKPLSTRGTSPRNERALEEQEIRLRAYQLYEQHGRQDGHDLDDWLQAELELAQERGARAA